MSREDADVRNACLMGTGGTWSLYTGWGATALKGEAAVRAVAVLMASVNLYGATPKRIDRAIELIERVGGPERLFGYLAKPGQMNELGVDAFVALEMAAHEVQERRVLVGEASSIGLEASEAREGAAIAEGLG